MASITVRQKDLQKTSRKKLIEVGSFWVNQKSKKVNQSAINNISNLPKQITQIQNQEFEVMHQNWPAYKFFLKVSAQWKYLPMGGICGLDYASVALPLSFEPKGKQKKLFTNLTWIEKGVLEAFREKQKK